MLLQANTPLKDVFNEIGLVEDCSIAENIPFKYGHRKMEDADIYFISNQDSSTQKTDLRFRTGNRQPELWNPIDGSIKKLMSFTTDGQTTTVPVTLHSFESAFIVFREKS